MDVDTIIRKGRIVDGTGNPCFVGDVAMAGGKIAAVASTIQATAARVIDATGLVVSPGFVDTHTHCDTTALVWPQQRNHVTQGTTTATSGQCGMSAGPDSHTFFDYITTVCAYGTSLFWSNALPLEESWTCQREYAAAVNRGGTAIDIAPYVGHGTLRWQVGARGPQPASQAQLDEMKRLLRWALEDGAVGATAGLSYDPNRYASYEEVLALARICGEYGRVYQIHAPYCANAAAARYSVRLARDARVKLSIAHYQALPSYWHEAEEMLSIVGQAREEGLDVTFNVMQDPHLVYDADGWKQIFLWVANTYGGCSWTAEGFTRDVVDPEFRRGLAGLMKQHIGKVADILPEYLELLPTAKLARTGTPELEGRTITDLARELKVDPEEFTYALICGQSGLVSLGRSPILSLSFAGNDDYIGEATLHDAGMPSTDVTPNESAPGLAEMTPWPVGYNTMPKFFRESRSRGAALEETVRHMTSLPASTMNLFDRGILREGLRGDVAIFDEAEFSPQATYENLTAPAAGVEWVFVAGTPIVEHGAQNGNMPGRMISVR